MYYFIVNERARTGKVSRIISDVKKALKSSGVPYKWIKTDYEGHAAELAGKISDLPEEDKTIVAVGGDGTLNEVVNGITDFENVKIALIPAGSGNDFAAGIKIKGDAVDILKRILTSKETDMLDVGQVIYNDAKDSRYFMISSGVGMDAIVCKNTITSRAKKVLNKIGLGKLTYLVITVQSLFSMETADVNVDFDGKESSMKKMIFTAAMNVRTEGGGVPMAPNADVRDGRLSFCSIHGIPKWKTFFYLPLLVMAKHEKIKGVGITDCQNARLKSHTPMVLHTDGEYLGDVFDVEYICHSRKLTFVKYY